MRFERNVDFIGEALEVTRRLAHLGTQRHFVRHERAKTRALCKRSLSKTDVTDTL